MKTTKKKSKAKAKAQEVKVTIKLEGLPGQVPGKVVAEPSTSDKLTSINSLVLIDDLTNYLDKFSMGKSSRHNAILAINYLIHNKYIG